MLPAYLALVVRGAGTDRTSALGRALAATVVMTLGFVTVFGGFGLLTTASGGLPAFLAYAAGFTLIVGTLAVAAVLAGSALTERLRRVMPYVNRISGVILVVVGAYVGYYGYYELALLSSSADPRDPV